MCSGVSTAPKTLGELPVSSHTLLVSRASLGLRQHHAPMFLYLFARQQHSTCRALNQLKHLREGVMMRCRRSKQASAQALPQRSNQASAQAHPQHFSPTSPTIPIQSGKLLTNLAAHMHRLFATLTRMHAACMCAAHVRTVACLTHVYTQHTLARTHIHASHTHTHTYTHGHTHRHMEAQDAIASWQFECGIPFNATRHPSWFEMWEAVRKAGPGLKPYSYNTLRGPVLKKVRSISICRKCESLET